MNFLISKKKMIDTIVLTISKEKFRTLDNTQGLYPSWGLQSRTFNYDKYVKNRKNDPRFPRLTFYKRKDDRTPYIKVEFSAGKILFNDNLPKPPPELQTHISSLSRSTLTICLELVNLMVLKSS